MMVMDVSFGQAHSVIGDMKSLAAKHLNRMDPAAAIVEELVEASTRSQNGNIRFTYEFQICNIHLLYVYFLVFYAERAWVTSSIREVLCFNSDCEASFLLIKELCLERVTWSGV